jgi:hypothetical protein
MVENFYDRTIKGAVEKAITPETVVHGVKTVSHTTATAIGSSTTLKQGVNIKPNSGNGSAVYIGGSGVTAETGYPLAATDTPVFVPCDNLADVYAVASASALSINFIGG